MTLPSSGQLSIGDIQVEMGRSATTANSSLQTLSNEAAEFDAEQRPNITPGAPYAMSEFYELELCFIVGTKVLMGDGRLLNIEDVKVGDLVETIDGVYPVTKLHVIPKHTKSLFSINDDNFFVTDNHPFMTKQGWKCLNLKNSKKDYLEDTPLQVEDFIQTSTGWIQIKKIQEETLPSLNINLYNFKVENKESYFANNYLVHNKCFVAGTLITMADETYKPIEEIQVGDEVFTQLGNQKVLEIVSPIHDDIIEYIFGGGIKTKNTADHPYYVVNKGWSSYEPLLSEQRYNVKSEQIEIGDEFIDDSDKKVKLEDVNEIPGKFQTYTFSTDSKTYYANTILVHSEI